MKKENHKNIFLSLYIHIPFCIKKCRYCDFLSAPAGEETQKEYVHALLKEIEYWGKALSGVRIKSVYIGGGTPSVLSGELISIVLCKLKEAFPDIIKMTKKTEQKKSTHKETAAEPEISIEVNPGTVTEEKLKAYKDAGINRISIGLQSAAAEELKLLGRIHTYEDFLETYHMARDRGFDNLNIDLISALPGQKLENWQGTLEKVLELKPEHISAYSLMIEEGTPFYETYSGHQELLPDEETDRAMYALTKHMLKQAGYERYEISNYSRTKRECLHNMVYWQRGNYLGLGIGSASMIENIRFRNTSSLEDYVNYWAADNVGERSISPIQEKYENQRKPFKIPSICQEIQCLTVQAQMEEFMFLGLRMIKGVSIKEFEAVFGVSIFQVYGRQIEKYKEQQVLTVSDRIALTDRGLDVSNLILADFLIN
ncbi:MAG: radical SAM family heme chaperone HemW [Roseburia sp.]|nr:radical SAM family heme chaperone HemW [Roseburia sp.]MCM1278081.1 radical SAM family heme chaperone HemW [Robinsoniella sp.]